jgi:thiol-disulfide isomerase/thioredoxin
MQLLDIYPAGDFYARVQQEYLRVQEAYKTAWARLAEQQPANRLLDEQRRLAAPFTGGIFTKQDRIRFWQQHFLDSVDLSSSTLQASHLLGQKLEQYMGMFGYPYAFGSRAAMDSGLLVAVKGIIDHCKNGSFSRKDAAAKTASLQFGAAWLYNFCTDKALDQCLGYTAGQLTEDVFTNTCNASPGTLQTLRRMQASQRLKPGMAAPEIALNGAEAKRLTDIKAGRTLVLFWASWCPHCQQELPLIKKLYDSTGHKGWEVLAVSIDTSGQAWAGAVAAGGYGWLNYCDRQGWDSPSAKDYGVFVTPAMYLLDEKKQIVARPATVEELKKWLSITEN